jgi:hypothetical protein
MTEPLTIDDGSELAEYLEHVVQDRPRWQPPLAAALFALLHVHEVRLGVWDGWNGGHGHGLGDPMAYDVGRWLRERFGI